MIKGLFFLFSFLISITACAQQWHPSHGVRGRDINSIAIFSRDNILTVGGNRENDSIQSIFQSGNEGLLWNIISDNISSWLTSMAFRDSLHGIAAGFNGKIIKTSDGGANWSRVNSPVYTRHFNKIVFIDSLNAFIAGGRQSNDSIQTIMKSIDGGNTWNIVYDQLGYWLRSIYFLDLQRGFAVGEHGTILKTTDGGASWLPQASPIQRNFNAITFINDSTGYIVGGNSARDSIRTILQTTDAGGNWSVLKDELGGWLTDIYFLNSDTGFISGYQSTLLRTNDGGSTWSPEVISAAASDEYFNTVSFHDNTFGVIGGRYGRVYVYTSSAVPQAQTTGHAIHDPTNVTLTGKASTDGYPGQYWFTISTDSTFSSSGQTYPVDVQSDTMTPVWHQLTGMIPNTIYYFYVTARTYAGTVSGVPLALFTYRENISLKTLPATGVKSASVRLNAEIDKLPLPAVVSFEYGLTPSLGSAITANPGQISDTLLHSVSASLNNLQPNSLYYYRIKAAAGHGINFYGQVQQVYTGFPIPNWDFQHWSDDTILLPYDWSVGGDFIERVPGHDGDFAVKIYRDNIILMGKIHPEGSANLFSPVMAFNARPDSITGFFNYNIAAGDTAFLLLQLTANGSAVAFQRCPIAGNSGGSFERLAFPIAYSSPAMPDSLALGMITINPFDTIDMDYANNYVIADDIAFTPSSPEVLNPGFENWFVYPHRTLESWRYLKYIYFDNIIRGDTPAVSQVFFEEPDDFAAQIRNIHAEAGTFLRMSMALEKPKPVFDGDGPFFPVYAQHVSLNGYFRFYPVNGDTMEISVEMYNQGVLIANGSFIRADSVTEFTPFAIAINYRQNILPDSGAIKINITTGYGPSRLIVDKLTFDGFVLPDDSDTTPAFTPIKEEKIKVYPNPAKNLVIVETSFQPEGETHLQLFDLNGRLAGTFILPPGQYRIALNTAGLQPGFYILRLQTGKTTFIRKIVVLN